MYLPVLSASPLEGSIPLVPREAVVLHLASNLGGGLREEEATVVDLVWLATVDLQTGGWPSRPGIMMRMFLLLFDSI